jgi:cysteine desulfurase family protein
MIYFDNAATGGFKPSAVIDSITNSIRYVNANAGRSGHRLSVSAGMNVLHTREALCEFFGGESPDRVIFTKNCTEALNISIQGCCEKDCHVISTVTEHNSVLRPLTHLKNSGKINLSLADIDENGIIQPESVLNLINDNTRVIVINLVSNVTGNYTDIKTISDAIKNKNITLICDGAQAAGHIMLNIKELGIDILCVAGHKGMYGIQGSSCIIFNKKTEILPIMFGGTGSESFNLNQPNVYPERLECGTLNYPAILSLYEGTAYVKKNLQSFSRTLKNLTEYLILGLKKIKNIEIYSEPNQFGIVSFRHISMQSEEIAYILSEKYDIAVRGGLHCAPLMHKALKTENGGLIRVSLSAHNKNSEISTFLSAINDITA